MKQAMFRTAIAGVFVLLMAGFARAQTQTIRIWPGVAPGSENWKQQERTYPDTPLGTVIMNVVTPTLTAYLPERAKANGTGVIIAPGGACVALAMGLEGYDVAHWLQQRGIAAFVLKYRIAEKRQQGMPQNIDMDQACKYGIADGIQAVKVVRQHAADWGVSPEKVGFIGFSAGGMIAGGALLQDQREARPNFAAFIYGAPFGAMPAIPAGLPPVFMAWAQNDNVALGPVIKYYDSLRAAGDKPEAHIYSAGGHGFGLKRQGTDSDHWIDEFYWWLQSHGFTK